MTLTYLSSIIFTSSRLSCRYAYTNRNYMYGISSEASDAMEPWLVTLLLATLMCFTSTCYFFAIPEEIRKREGGEVLGGLLGPRIKCARRVGCAGRGVQLV